MPRMIRKNHRKTLRVLYLYLTLPLLLAALVLWLSFDSEEELAPEPDSMTPAAKSVMRMCMDRSDCYIGENCIHAACVNPLRIPPKIEEPEATQEVVSDAGWAAIITAVMGGLTGLLAAVTHTIVAFLEMKERKRS